MRKEEIRVEGTGMKTIFLQMYLYTIWLWNPINAASNYETKFSHIKAQQSLKSEKQIDIKLSNCMSSSWHNHTESSYFKWP